MAMIENTADSGGKNVFRVNKQSEEVGGKFNKTEGRKNQPVFVNLVTLERLYFQNIPGELDYDPNTSWAILPSLGRNSPLYQYTGAEDTLKFNLSWYSDEATRQDVIKKCKWLEAMSKPDGYDNPVPECQLIFGELFSDAKWIVFAAPFKMSNFNREKGMLPQLATQEVTLKRVSTKNPGKVDYQNIHF